MSEHGYVEESRLTRLKQLGAGASATGTPIVMLFPSPVLDSLSCWRRLNWKLRITTGCAQRTGRCYKALPFTSHFVILSALPARCCVITSVLMALIIIIITSRSSRKEQEDDTHAFPDTGQGMLLQWSCASCCLQRERAAPKRWQSKGSMLICYGISTSWRLFWRKCTYFASCNISM